MSGSGSGDRKRKQPEQSRPIWARDGDSENAEYHIATLFPDRQCDDDDDDADDGNVWIKWDTGKEVQIPKSRIKEMEELPPRRRRDGGKVQDASSNNIKTNSEVKEENVKDEPAYNYDTDDEKSPPAMAVAAAAVKMKMEEDKYDYDTDDEKMIGEKNDSRSEISSPTMTAAAVAAAKMEVEEDEYVYDTDDEKMIGEKNDSRSEIPSPTMAVAAAAAKTEVEEDEYVYDIDDEELIGEKNDSRSAIGEAAAASAKVEMTKKTPLVDFDQLKAGSRVLVADSEGTWKATIRKVIERKKEQGFVIHYDGLKKSSEIWVSWDRVVGIIMENRGEVASEEEAQAMRRTERVRKIGEEASVTLIDFNTLKPCSRVIVVVGKEAWKATITSPMEEEGQKGFIVQYGHNNQTKETHDTSEESNHVWVRRDRVLDIIIQDTNEIVNVAKVAKDSVKQVEFSRLGVGSHVFVLGGEGPYPAHVKECCLQGCMVNYEWQGDDELPSCWVAWNRIANVFYDNFEKKVKVANDTQDKVIRLLMKSEYAGASEIYNKACDEEGGKPPKLWAAEVALYVRRHIKADDEADIYFPNLPPRPLGQEI